MLDWIGTDFNRTVGIQLSANNGRLCTLGISGVVSRFGDVSVRPHAHIPKPGTSYRISERVYSSIVA
jgi:hypothetical protein